MGDYRSDKFGSWFLEDMKTFIHDEYSIDELYDEKEIAEWLEDNANDYGYIKDTGD